MSSGSSGSSGFFNTRRKRLSKADFMDGATDHSRLATIGDALTLLINTCYASTSVPFILSTKYCTTLQ